MLFKLHQKFHFWVHRERAKLFRRCVKPVWFRLGDDSDIYARVFYQYGYCILGLWVVGTYKSGASWHLKSECDECFAVDGWGDYGHLILAEHVCRYRTNEWPKGVSANMGQGSNDN